MKGTGPAQLIAIDGRVLKRGQAGRARYTRCLIEAWMTAVPDDRVVLYLSASEERAEMSLPPSWEAVIAPDSLRGSWWIAHDAARRKVHVILAPTNYSLGAVSRVPTVTIVYDLAALYLADHRPTFRIWFPEWIMMRLAVRRAAHLIVISEFTKQELVRRYPEAAKKTTVVYGGVEERFFETPTKMQLARVRKKYGLPEQFLLFVGTLEPRKNLVRLLGAFGRLSETEQRQFPLYLAGNLGWSHDAILTSLSQFERRGVVRRIGYVADQDLPLLYRLAHVTLYPSLYEGFGLPALEALAAHGVVLTSNTSSLPEVVGVAAFTVDPLSVTALSKGLEQLIHEPDLRKRLGFLSVKQARQFDWTTSAHLTRQLLLNVAETA